MIATRNPTPSRPPLPALLLCLAALSPLPLLAQTPGSPGNPPTDTPSPPAPRPAPYINHNLILLDAAHGGSDDGAHIGDHLLEKDVTLALASRIRTLLLADNLNVLSTRETDATSSPLDPLSPAQSSDARAGIANHAHPLACILIHATGAGIGVHVFTSSLEPPDPNETPTNRPIPWDAAQAPSIPQSQRLAADLSTSLTRAGLPVHLEHASVRPIDSLQCPAVAIEIAPLTSGPNEVSSPVYQGRVAQAVATALLFWRNHADLNAGQTPTPVPSNPVPRRLPAPHPKPRPIPPTATPAQKPAPIIRRPPSPSAPTGAQP